MFMLCVGFRASLVEMFMLCVWFRELIDKARGRCVNYSKKKYVIEFIQMEWNVIFK